MRAFLRSFSAQRFWETLKRFPLSILSGAVAAGIVIWTGADWQGYHEVERLFVSSFVGILLFTGLSLLAERTRLRGWLLQVVGVLVLWALLFNADFGLHGEGFYLRAALLFLASLGLIFVGPYVTHREPEGFFAWSVRVWARAMLAIVTSILMVGALSLALVSIQNLFDVEINPHWFEYLYAVFVIFVPNIVFLMGVPDDYKALDRPAEVLDFRSFSTFLGLPIFSVYFVILVAYLVKILTTGVWPNGFVAMPILFFSMVGFGTYVLAFPLLKNNVLLRTFSRVFLWSLPVFLVVYFIALGIRISDYGVTEMRYLGVLLGVLLLGWTLYFGLTKKAELRVIPLTLALVAFLSSFGPWGVFAVSACSQMSRLEGMLTANGLLVDGAVVPSTDANISAEALRQISGQVEEVYSLYGSRPFAPLFGTAEEVEKLNEYDLMKKLGLTLDTAGGFVEDPYFYADGSAPLLVQGYDYSFLFSQYVVGESPVKSTYTLGKKMVEVSVDINAQALVFSSNGHTLSVSFAELVKTLEDSGSHDIRKPEEMMVSAENGFIKARVYFTGLNLQGDETPQTLDLQSTVLVKLK